MHALAVCMSVHMPDVCPSALLTACSARRIDETILNLVLKSFIKLCRDIPVFILTGQNIGQFVNIALNIFRIERNLLITIKPGLYPVKLLH